MDTTLSTDRPATTAASNLPGGIAIEELRRHVTVVQRKLEAGQHLYRAGQPFQAVYLVHSGFLKTSQVSEDGREQVTGFRMRGDLLGAESIGTATHAGDAVALDASVVWELSYPAVLKACADAGTAGAADARTRRGNPQ